MELDRMSIGDYEALIGLWKAAGLEHRPEGRDSRASIAKDLLNQSTFFILAREDGELIGSVICTDDGRKGWINRLAVLPSHQRRGIATRLVEAAEEHFRTSGVNVYSIIVYRDNASSLALFHSLGYEDHEETIYLSKKMDPKA